MSGRVDVSGRVTLLLAFADRFLLALAFDAFLAAGFASLLLALCFFGVAEPEANRDLDRTVDEIRSRFGNSSLRGGSQI